MYKTYVSDTVVSGGEVQCSSNLALAGVGRDAPLVLVGVSPTQQKGLGTDKPRGALHH